MAKTDIDRLREKLEQLFTAEGMLTEAGIEWFGEPTSDFHAVDALVMV